MGSAVEKHLLCHTKKMEFSLQDPDPGAESRINTGSYASTCMTWTGSSDSVPVDVCHTFSVRTDGDRTSPSQVILTDQIHCPPRVLPDQHGFLFALVFTDTPPSVTGEQDSHDLSTGMMKPDYLSYQILDINLLQFKCETLYYHTWLVQLLYGGWCWLYCYHCSPVSSYWS